MQIDLLRPSPAAAIARPRCCGREAEREIALIRIVFVLVFVLVFFIEFATTAASYTMSLAARIRLLHLTTRHDTTRRVLLIYCLITTFEQ